MRYLRGVLFVLLGFACIGLIIVMGLYAFITPERVSERVAQALNHQLGIVLQEPLRPAVKRLPALRITVPANRFYQINAPECRGSFAELTIDMNPFAFFASSPRIKAIHIDQLQASINEQTLAQLNKRNEPERHTDFIEVDSLTAANAGLIWSDEPGYRLTDIRLTASNISRNGADIGLSALLASTETALSGKLTLRTSLSRNNPDHNNSFVLQAPVLTFNGLVHREQTDLELQSERVGQLLSLAPRFEGFHLKGKLANTGSVDISGRSAYFDRKVWHLDTTTTQLTVPTSMGTWHVDADPRSMTLSQARIVVPSTPVHLRLNTVQDPKALTGDLLIQINWEAAKQTGDFALQGVLSNRPVNIALSVTPAAVPAPENTGASPLEAPETPAQALEQDTPTPDTRQALQAQDVPVRPFISGSVTLTALPDTITKLLIERLITLPSKADGKINLAIDLPRAHLNAPVELSDGKWHLKNGSIDLAQGEAAVSGQLDTDGHWQGTVHLDRIHVSRLKAFQTCLDGLLYGDLTADGNLLAQSVSARGSARLEKGYIRGFDVLKAAAILRAEQPDTVPYEALNADAHTAFDIARIDSVQYRDAQLTLNAVTVQAPAWSALFNGRLNHGEFTLKGDISPLSPSGSVLFTFPSVCTASADQKPAWTIRWQPALAREKARAGELGWSFELMENKVKREVSNWWEQSVRPRMESSKEKIQSVLPDWISNNADDETKPAGTSAR